MNVSEQTTCGEPTRDLLSEEAQKVGKASGSKYEKFIRKTELLRKYSTDYMEEILDSVGMSLAVHRKDR